MRAVIKIGGALLESQESRERLAAQIKDAWQNCEIVVVHGWGKQGTQFLAEHGIESEFRNGLRVTTEPVRDAILKVAGSVNAYLVSALQAAGVNAIGLRGLDGGLVAAEPMDPELGYVGRPVSANAELLNTLVGIGRLPVIACIAGDGHGAIYNVNGDQVAAACGQAFQADKLIFLTDVDGVRNATGNTAASLTVGEALALISSGVAKGGMQAKLESAITALRAGVKEVRIVPGVLECIVTKALAGESVGTRVTC